MGQWVAPTLNPEELEKRIEELKTVQFWLEQNARLLGATIQALEVQRMTLSTLKTMNVQMGDLRDSLKIRVPGMGGMEAPAAEPDVESEDDPADEPDNERVQAAAPAPKAPKPKATANSAADAPPAVDPMQWWGALTKQFTELAATAMKDTATDAAKNLAGAVIKQSVSAAGKTLKKAVTPRAKAAPRSAARPATKTATKTAAKPAAKRTAAKR